MVPTDQPHDKDPKHSPPADFCRIHSGGQRIDPGMQTCGQVPM
jgi:hypothetical protein